MEQSEQIKLKASCPVCGRNLFRGSPHSFIEGHCAKCSSFLRIAYESTGVVVNLVEGAAAKK